VFDPKLHRWSLERGLQVDFNASGDVEKRTDFQTTVQNHDSWTETPWRIASAQSEPQNLSIPELHDYLRYNGDFPEVQLAPYRAYLHHRWALPFQAFVVVFIGAPLAIVFSRRGVVGGVAAAILLYAGLILATYLFLALGKGWRISALVAAWIPNTFFFLIGLVLLYFRSTNRDLPSLSPDAHESGMVHPTSCRSLCRKWRALSRRRCLLHVTLLREGEFRREDLSEAAFKARNENIQPFSFWRSKFEMPPPPAPEALGKQTAEDLLRRYMAEQSPELSNARYILAIMLERKKLLKEIETRRGDDGSLCASTST
jgi:hypothetical protein